MLHPCGGNVTRWAVSRSAQFLIVSKFWKTDSVPLPSRVFSPATSCFLGHIFQMLLCSSTSDSNSRCRILQHLLNVKFNPVSLDASRRCFSLEFTLIVISMKICVSQKLLMKVEPRLMLANRRSSHLFLFFFFSLQVCLWSSALLPTGNQVCYCCHGCSNPEALRRRCAGCGAGAGVDCRAPRVAFQPRYVTGLHFVW